MANVKTKHLFLAASLSALMTVVACSPGGKAASSDSGATASEGAPQSVPAMAETSDELILQARDFLEPVPVSAPTIEGVTATPELVGLGQALFFDPRLLPGRQVHAHLAFEAFWACPHATHIAKWTPPKGPRDRARALQALADIDRDLI